MQGIKSVGFLLRMIGAELSNKALAWNRSAFVPFGARCLVRCRQLTYRVCQDATKAGRVVSEKHVPCQQAKAGKKQHRGHQRPRRLGFRHQCG